ncbi:MAG: 4Fe-4S binding protein [Armatimonadetes bacterium]|nr:4Fe-4S binding protein [Armatimonadota bacterium]
MFGKGLIKGLQITWREMLAQKVTVQYPDEQIPLPDRYHGRFELDADKCIACMLCANACPNKVIQIERTRVGKKQYLTKYVMRIEYCMFCGLCVESCNQDALRFSKVFNMNQYFRSRVRLTLADRPAPAEEPAEEAGSEQEAKKKAPAPKKPAGAGSEAAAGKS